MTAQDFINSFQPKAIDIYNQYGILPSITIGQAALESGWGTSYLSSAANNYYGIKGVGTAGSVSLWDDEAQPSNFRKYNSVDESVNDYAALLSGSNYTAVKNAGNYKSAAMALQSAGYATDPQYSTKLIGIIQDNGLYNLDNAVKSNNGSVINTSMGGLPNSSAGQNAKDELKNRTDAALSSWSMDNVFKNLIFLLIGIVALALGLYFLLS